MADLILREAALDVLVTSPNFHTTLTRIEELPTVDAIPVVHGQWIDEEGNPVPWCDAHPSSPAFSCWCNQCGEWLVASDEYPVYGLFCPVCGAKMDGEWRGKDAVD